MDSIGILGLGRMGQAVALRLLDQGRRIRVWNRTPARATPLAAAGATVVSTPAALVADSAIVLSLLWDDAAVEAVFADLLAADLTGRLVVEMSTVRPATTIALAARVAARGGAFLDCPVGGTTGPARTGQLLGLCGGTAADLARARPVLDLLCRRIEHVGPVGSGAAMKLAINLPLAVYYQTLGEALTLCRHLGLPADRVIALFAESQGGSNVLRTRGEGIAAALAGGALAEATFDVDGVRKDLRTMLETGRMAGAALPLTAQALRVYDAAAAAGWGSRDGTSLAAFWPGQDGPHPPPDDPDGGMGAC